MVASSRALMGTDCTCLVTTMMRLQVGGLPGFASVVYFCLIFQFYPLKSKCREAPEVKLEQRKTSVTAILMDF